MEDGGPRDGDGAIEEGQRATSVGYENGQGRARDGWVWPRMVSGWHKIVRDGHIRPCRCVWVFTIVWDSSSVWRGMGWDELDNWALTATEGEFDDEILCTGGTVVDCTYFLRGSTRRSTDCPSLYQAFICT